jgi:hypothetical protein
MWHILSQIGNYKMKVLVEKIFLNKIGKEIIKLHIKLEE